MYCDRKSSEHISNIHARTFKIQWRQVRFSCIHCCSICLKKNFPIVARMRSKISEFSRLPSESHGGENKYVNPSNACCVTRFMLSFVCPSRSPDIKKVSWWIRFETLTVNCFCKCNTKAVSRSFCSTSPAIFS